MNAGDDAPNGKAGGAPGAAARLCRRGFLAGLAATGAGAALAAAPASAPRPRPRPALAISAGSTRTGAELVRAAGLAGDVGFVLFDMRTGRQIEQFNEAAAMPPASVVKTATALYALEALGPRHRYETRLAATGPVSGGTLAGDLVLVGGGDPTLDTDAMERLALRLREAGVRSIAGRFLVDAAALPHVRAIDPEQPEHLGYNPAIDGLNLNYNRIHFEWRAAQGGYTVALDARSNRLRPTVSMADIRVVGRERPVYDFVEEGGRERWTVARSALGNGGSRWLPVRRPALYAGEVLQSVAREKGIALPAPREGRLSTAGTVLALERSDELSVILRDMLRFSTNLTAEVAGLSASLRRGIGAAGLPASARAMAQWMTGRVEGVAPHFVDHSGLGDAARLSARDMGRKLVDAGWDGPLRGLLRETPPRDDQGRRMENFPARIVAKTGTLHFVSSLAGYIAPPNGRSMAFAILTADMPRRSRLSRAERERPEGARPWAQRARRLQNDLLRHWVAAYGV